MREMTGIDRRLDRAKPVEEGAVASVARQGFIWGLLRLALGWTFLWAFLDKLLALGFATGRNPETGRIDFFGPDAWINSGSPTGGFLEFGTKGPFAEFFQGLAGAFWVDWVYMLSMLGLGVALILGIGVRLAGIAGAIWMGLFYAAGFIWPQNNPLVDNHVIYAIVLLGIAHVGAGRWLGLGGWWSRTRLVRRFPILQ